MPEIGYHQQPKILLVLLARLPDGSMIIASTSCMVSFGFLPSSSIDFHMAKQQDPSPLMKDHIELLGLFEKELTQIEDEFMRTRRDIHVNLANRQIEASDTNIPESVLSTWGNTDQASVCFDHLLFEKLRKQKNNQNLEPFEWQRHESLVVVNISSRYKSSRKRDKYGFSDLIHIFMRLFLIQDRWLQRCRQYHHLKAKILGGSLTTLEWHDLRMILEERRIERAMLGIFSPRLFSYGAPFISSAGNLDKYGNIVTTTSPPPEPKWGVYGEWVGDKWNWSGYNVRLACILVSLKNKRHLRVRSNYDLATYAWKHFLIKGNEIKLVSFQSTISWFVSGHYKGDVASQQEMDFGIYVLKRK